MGKVGKTACRMEHVVGDVTSVQKVSDFGIRLEGEQRGIRMELVINDPSVEKEMHCWVEVGGWGR